MAAARVRKRRRTGGLHAGRRCSTRTLTDILIEVITAGNGMKTISVDGVRFRDLDHDGVLAPYEDHRLTAEARARDLLTRMTLAEKAGVMMHGSARSHGPLGVIGVGSQYDIEANHPLIAGDSINHLITRLDGRPSAFAEQNNALQEIAAATRLGIPLTISTDPRHHFQHVTGASSRAQGFSQWPETTGLAAIGSSELVQQFAEIARDEYRAVGIHMALSPQADLATEPRWSRISGTFGEDPQLARRLVKAYVVGMQGARGGVRASGVSCVVKHWVGYGAAPDGYDGHNFYGRFSALTEASLPLHIEPFLGAFEAGVAGVMPTYTILKDLVLKGELLQQVAGGFNRQLIQHLLRDTCQFRGFVLSDWAIHRDATETTFNPKRPQSPDDIAMPWGVESLTRQQRFAKSINAGIDQLGGEEDVATLMETVDRGLVPQQRIDEAVCRLLIVKFQQGLFDNPFVDAQAAAARVGSPHAIAAGRDAQRRSLVCLKKPKRLAVGAKVHLVNFASGGAPVERADAAVIRLATPHESLHPNHFFGNRQQEGDIDFKKDSTAMRQLNDLASRLPTTAVIQMPRPAVISNLMALLDGIYVEMGVDEDVLINEVLASTATEASLPFELPSSMDAVRAQRPDLPGDSDHPLFELGSNHRSKS